MLRIIGATMVDQDKDWLAAKSSACPKIQESGNNHPRHSRRSHIMNYCCTEFEEAIGQCPLTGLEFSDHWIFWTLESYGISKAVDIKFCPFCGTDLAPRFYVEQSNILGCWYSQQDKTVAYFDSKGNAEEHANNRTTDC